MNATNSDLGLCPCACLCGAACDHVTCPCVECVRARLWAEFQTHIENVRTENVGKIDRRQAMAWPEFLRARKPAKPAKPETFAVARARILAELAAMGWETRPALKFPWAQKDGIRFNFKTQAVYLHEHSLVSDFRGMTAAALVAYATR